MKTPLDFAKEIGWIGVVGSIVLVAGLAIGLDVSPKDFFELSSAA